LARDPVPLATSLAAERSRPTGARTRLEHAATPPAPLPCPVIRPR
jgi:hypothetical protein